MSEVFAGLNEKELSLEALKTDFHVHNQQVLDLAMLLLEKRFKEEPAVFDAYMTHMLMLADELYIGVR